MDKAMIVKALTERMAGTRAPGGMVGEAADKLVDRDYQIHVQESVAQGMQPQPRSTWAASRK